MRLVKEKIMRLLFNSKNDDYYNPNVTITYLTDDNDIKMLYVPLKFNTHRFVSEGVEKLEHKHNLYKDKLLADYDDLIKNPTSDMLMSFLDNYDDAATYKEHHDDFYDGIVFEKEKEDELWEQLLFVQSVRDVNKLDSVKRANLFLKRLDNNVNPFIAQQLRKFLYTTLATNGHKLHIDENGDLIAYKAVLVDADEITMKRGYKSIHRGNGVVDGKEYLSENLPQNVGSVVTMKRSEVASDPYSACSYGLHAGTFKYANEFGNSTGHALLAVRIAPEDIISVPYDSNAQKIRCCKYEVLYEVERSPELIPIYDYEEDYDEDYDEEYCDY